MGGLGQLMDVACNRMRSSSTDQQDKTACSETGINNCFIFQKSKETR